MKKGIQCGIGPLLVVILSMSFIASCGHSGDSGDSTSETALAISKRLPKGYTLLYNFAGPTTDGASPMAGVTSDKHGNLYGTTYWGGANNLGTVFKLDASGMMTVLHSFSGADGAYPSKELIMDNKGNLYGTTDGCIYDITNGCVGTTKGTVFKLDTRGTLTVLYSFTGTDGQYPSKLVMDSVGNLYGTTMFGGSDDWGTVFKLDRNGTMTVLHNFTEGTGDGLMPIEGLIMDSVGNLYGTTYDGGEYGWPGGTVFKLDTSGTLTLLHSFNVTDGQYPSKLAMDTIGNLYGTTWSGGADNLGVVFKLDTSGTLTVLHSFTGIIAMDGSDPSNMIIDKSGNLYGTTWYGEDGHGGWGTVFKMDTIGNMSVLHNFTAEEPVGVTMDNKGIIYGTTFGGGLYNAGTLFRIVP